MKHKIINFKKSDFQAMMDREKKDELPKMQLSFIDEICLPLYKVGTHFRN